MSTQQNYVDNVSHGVSLDPQLMSLEQYEETIKLSRPAPGRNFTCCSGIPGFGRGHGQGQSKYF